MIIQGTTPTHTFTLPFDTDLIKSARYVYSAGEQVVLRKDTEDLTLDGMDVSVTLTQDETYKFTPGATVALVLRALLHDGNALETDPVPLRVRGCADKEVLV